MPARQPNLRGSVQDRSSIALLLIDVINDLDFPEAEEMLGAAIEMADNLREFKSRARAAKIPCVYVNDNFGRWQSDFRRQVGHCLERGVRGRPVVERLQPCEDDYFVLKPKHSGFYSTNLDVLLGYLGVTDLILSGIAGNLCVLYTANDAYMRDYTLYVPADCTVSNTPQENEYALEQMRKSLKAVVSPGAELDLEELSGKSRLRPQALET